MMSLQKKGLQVSDAKISNSRKATGLNPNAAEFIPFSLRSSASGSSKSVDATARSDAIGTLGKVVLERSESAISNNSDDEAHHFWRCQLPDDITPDFKVTSEDDPQGFADHSLASLSLYGDDEPSSFPASNGSGFLLSKHQRLSQQRINGGNPADKLRVSDPTYADSLTTIFSHILTNSRGSEIGNSNQLAIFGRDKVPFDSKLGFINEVLGEDAIMNETDINPLELLISKFPGFGAESLADLYFANGCDLSLTIEMLSQLELQVDGCFNQSPNARALSAPRFDAIDFHAPTSPDGHHLAKHADGIQLINNPHQMEKDRRLLFNSDPSLPSRRCGDFVSAVRKLASQDSGMWKYQKNGYTGATIGPSRSPHVLAGSYTSEHGRVMYGDRLQNHGSSRVPSVWLETGDADANLCFDMHEEAQDNAHYAHLRSAYFEQARQAYLFGNKVVSKDPSAKGQLYNMHMKADHGKAQESIYRQRNPIATEVRGNDRGERMIDLHGLHVTEALHVLRNELHILRNMARTAGQRLQVYICVDTGHHNRSPPSPVRLPIAVQRYLLEEEGLEYTEPHAGLLRVVIF